MMLEIPPSDPGTISFGSEETHLHVKAMCKKLLQDWQGESMDGMYITTISGGISNLIVKVTPSSSALKPVVFKVFGEKTELLVDRELELQTLIKLNACGFGAKVLGTFSNGRIEEFLLSKTLEPQDMADPLYVPCIARKLRLLHAVPLNDNSSPTLWPTIMGWLDMAASLVFQDEAKKEQFCKLDLGAMKREIKEVKAACDAIQSSVVFSHNDLLSGNILILQQPENAAEEAAGPRDDSMQFIDYEYSACGFRGYDFGNHFNEYAGFECDYSRYPSPEAQRLFFKHYLSERADQISSGLPSNSLSHPDNSASAPEQELQLQRMEAEANLFALASHMYWGVWSLIQARYSPIDFDYLQYSATRWAEYRKKKVGCLRQAKEVFSG